MTCKTDKISLKLLDDAFSQSICFDYMGERMLAITLLDQLAFRVNY